MSWHRPYLALYETILAGHVQTIAKSYNNQVYQNAADQFRIPYWDWAAPPYGMPDFFSTDNITITTPTGPQGLSNPLATYRFKRRPYPSTTFPSDSTLMNTYDRTVRRPDENGNSDPDAVNSLLTSQAPSIAQQLYTVFTRATVYNNMATQSSSGPSFEGPHGWLHITTGGDGGHMTDVGYAGFDPIFLLHHTNVDRLGAMWQAIYPSSFMTPAKEGAGTFNLVRGQTISSTTPLIPFHQADGKTPWTPDAGRYLKTFGYSYPDVKDWAYSADAAGQSNLKSNVTARVNTLYNLRRSNRKRDLRTFNPRGTTPSNPPREWTVSISAHNAALGGGSYSVQLFLGPAPQDRVQWVVQSVGSMYVLAQPMSAVSLTSLTTPLVSRTEVVITDFLSDRGIDTKDVEATKKFIDSNLSWGVQRVSSLLSLAVL